MAVHNFSRIFSLHFLSS